MNNADYGNQPASPLPIAMNETECLTVQEYEGSLHFNGLTKREHFAESILNGLLSSGINIQLGPNSKENNDKMAKCAVVMADSLLAALNQTQGE